MRNNFYDTSYGFSWHRLLRRTLHRSDQYSAIMYAHPLYVGAAIIADKEMLKGVGFYSPFTIDHSHV
jgi:hypothetical protein